MCTFFCQLHKFSRLMRQNANDCVFNMYFFLLLFFLFLNILIQNQFIETILAQVGHSNIFKSQYSKIQNDIIKLRFYNQPYMMKEDKTISKLIDQISFSKPKKKKLSETDSLSSTNSFDSVQVSKMWTKEKEELFIILLKSYGTDFSILTLFFPKKTKNQLKHKYKQIHKKQIKLTKQQNAKLMAVQFLFKEEAIQNQEDN